MSLWEIFVLEQVRLCLALSYDELHFMSNDSSLLRGILGVLPTDFSTGKQYEYQNIYDNEEFSYGHYLMWLKRSASACDLATPPTPTLSRQTVMLIKFDKYQSINFYVACVAHLNYIWFMFNKLQRYV